MKKITAFLLAAALMAAMLLSGCAQQAAPTAAPPTEPPATATLPPTQAPVEPTKTEAPPPPIEEPTPDPTEEPQPIRLTDAAGREVVLEKLPERIVYIGRGVYMPLHAAYMFPEAKDRVAGIEKRGETASDFLSAIIDGFDQVPVLEANPGPEQVAALNPDLVIMKGLAPGQIDASLELLGIPTVYLGLETPEQYVVDIENLGIIFGNPERAKEIQAFYQEKLDRILEKTSTLAEDEKPTVLMVEYSDRGGEVASQVPPPGWMQTIHVQNGGGNPIWLPEVSNETGWNITNIEQITSWDPEKIIVIVWYTIDPVELLETLKADPLWAGLSAVKNDQLYAMPSDIYGWDTPDVRWILGTTWVAKTLHPDLFPDVDIRQEVFEFYSTLYGMDDATIENVILSAIRTGL